MDMDPDPDCPDRLDPGPDPVNIRPDLKPLWQEQEQLSLLTDRQKTEGRYQFKCKVMLSKV